MSEQPRQVESRRYTVAEYFELENSAELRHEFIDGQILDMAGGSDAHAQIAANLFLTIGRRLEGKPCSMRTSDMRIKYGHRVNYGYADALVVCGKPEFDPRDQNTLLNPKVIIEVLSDSTETFDRGNKSVMYREIESLGDYVLVSQNEPAVEVISRQNDGTWLIHSYRGLDAEARLICLNLRIPLREIFAGVEFPPPTNV